MLGAGVGGCSPSETTNWNYTLPNSVPFKCKNVHLQCHACTPCCVTIPVVSDVQAQHVGLRPCEVMLAWSGYTQQLCAHASEPPMLTQQLCCAHAQLQPPFVHRQAAQ
jgi:hypothetical protein